MTATKRLPAETPGARMGALATLPVFFKLGGRSVLHIYESAPGDALLLLAAENPERIHIHLRPWSVDVFNGMALAIGAIGDEAEAMAFRCAAKAAGVPVNVVDRPAFCDFSFGSIVNRSPLVIGISTDGAAPVFGQTIRARIETMLPTGFARWAEAAKHWRERIEPLALAFRLRRAFWERFSVLALAEPERKPDDRDFNRILDATMGETSAATRGSVVIVGAGPGDPELLTLKAVRALQSADVVLYDDLVSDGVLGFARREARKIAVGKRAGAASCKQKDICAEILSHARAGKRVVRLKGGDPAIFGRLDEELEACRAEGFEPELVPGVTTASGAAAALGLSLTRRRTSHRLQFITAHGADGGLPAELDLDALADPAATTCVYMGSRTILLLADALMARGLSATTPVRVVVSATRPDMLSISSTLENAARDVASRNHDGPVMILIGKAMGLHQTAGSSSPQSGQPALDSSADMLALP